MSDADMTTAMSTLGGQIMCSSSRETIIYPRHHYVALSLISETVQNASLLPEELEAQRAAAEYEIRELGAKPEVILPEMYRPERMVIAGAGVAHEELVELVDKHFSSLKYGPVVDGLTSTVSLSRTSPSVPPNLLHPQPPNAASSYSYPNSSAPVSLGTGSTYTGGYRFIHDPQSEFNHIYISFEGVGIHDDDIYELATMQVALARLCTHILNHHAAIDHCASFHHIYNDSSLFGLSAVLPHLIHQLALLLYRAQSQNQLKSSLAMALESRSVEVEDLGRQLLVHNRKIPVSEMADKIDAVTTESLQRVALRIFGPQSGGKPTVLAMGRHDLSDWQAQFRKYEVGTI
ncbi:peptidase M16 inactive domain-containing protein [Russula aff. rugulosa BPL654]|nr:peptidase M16 inactive domain-containing protein [Russula aff. rugulosa BPL654]